jgi:hypothetical protein
MEAGKGKSRTKTPSNKSKKAHVKPPPRKLAPRGEERAQDEREIGQFSGQGTPPLLKK